MRTHDERSMVVSVTLFIAAVLAAVMAAVVVSATVFVAAVEAAVVAVVVVLETAKVAGAAGAGSLSAVSASFACLRLRLGLGTLMGLFFLSKRKWFIRSIFFVVGQTHD